jgi:hypothetical protein
MKLNRSLVWVSTEREDKKRSLVAINLKRLGDKIAGKVDPIALGASDLEEIQAKVIHFLIRGSLVRIKVKVLDKDQWIPPLAFQGWSSHINEMAL